jgi:flavodoxin
MVSRAYQHSDGSSEESNGMKAWVVYDSVFGNTEKVAQAMGDALGAQAEVQTLRVGNAKPEHLAGLDVLIVGSPTRAFRATPAIAQWLKSLPSNSLNGVQVAAFDTRIAVEDTNSALLKGMVKLFGYAAKPIGSRLAQKGGNLALAPEGFYVKGSEGPLRDGELERAAHWARQLLTA